MGDWAIYASVSLRYCQKECYHVERKIKMVKAIQIWPSDNLRSQWNSSQNYCSKNVFTERNWEVSNSSKEVWNLNSFNIGKCRYISNHAPFHLKHISRSSRQIIVLWELLNSIVYYQIFILRFYKNMLSQQLLVTWTVRKSQGTSLLKKKQKQIFRPFECTICYCWICSFQNVHGQGINKCSLFIPATGIFICSKTFVWILKFQIWSSVIGIHYWLQSLPPNIKQDPAKF